MARERVDRVNLSSSRVTVRRDPVESRSRLIESDRLHAVVFIYSPVANILRHRLNSLTHSRIAAFGYYLHSSIIVFAASYYIF